MEIIYEEISISLIFPIDWEYRKNYILIVTRIAEKRNTDNILLLSSICRLLSKITKRHKLLLSRPKMPRIF